MVFEFLVCPHLFVLNVSCWLYRNNCIVYTDMQTITEFPCLPLTLVAAVLSYHLEGWGLKFLFHIFYLILFLSHSLCFNSFFCAATAKRNTVLKAVSSTWLSFLSVVFPDPSAGAHTHTHGWMDVTRYWVFVFPLNLCIQLKLKLEGVRFGY